MSLSKQLMSESMVENERRVYERDSLDRFGDDLMEVLVSFETIEDNLKHQLVSKQWKQLVFRRQSEMKFSKELYQRLNSNIQSINDFLKRFESLLNMFEGIEDIDEHILY